MGSRRAIAPAVLLAAMLAGTTASPAAPPGTGKPGATASFSYAPVAPVSGELVRFTSTSTAIGPSNDLVLQVWDLDADGAFDDAVGASAERSFPSAGAYTVSLRVVDRHDNSAVAFQNVTVAGRPGEGNATRLLTPFPIVRMAGSVSRRGTHLRRLSVETPRGSVVSIRCRGRGCPVRRQARQAVDFESHGSQARVIRIRRFERRLLRAGVVMKVLVTKRGTIGKYTRFKIRKRKPPARTDRCLSPDGRQAVGCPAT